MVVIPTDKTNAFRTVELTKYIEWVKNHLSKSATIMSKENLANIFDLANSLLQDITTSYPKNQHKGHTNSKTFNQGS